MWRFLEETKSAFEPLLALGFELTSHEEYSVFGSGEVEYQDGVLRIIVWSDRMRPFVFVGSVHAPMERFLLQDVLRFTGDEDLKQGSMSQKEGAELIARHLPSLHEVLSLPRYHETAAILRDRERAEVEAQDRKWAAMARYRERFDLEKYPEQQERLPRQGRHVIAHYDDEHIVVYQAYSETIGAYAAEHGRFQRGFSFERTSWIKPSFLWMMYRSGWGTKEGQTVVLALTLKRNRFDAFLGQGVLSHYDPEIHASREEWKRQIGSSDVVVQWDPDRSPKLGGLERRAIQIGLRNEALAGWDGTDLVAVEDISEHVAELRGWRETEDGIAWLPRQRVYPVSNEGARQRLGIG